MGFTQSHSGPESDIKGFVQMIPGSFKSDKPIIITGVDKIHRKANCIDGSIVNGVREPFLHSFPLDKLRGHKIYKKPRIKLFKRMNESVLSHVTFHLEDDDHKPVDFIGETISFTGQLIEK